MPEDSNKIRKEKVCLPDLISLEDQDALKASHFFSSTANWVIPGAVMAGQSPARADDVATNMQTLRVDGGITTFVCLQAEVDPQVETSEGATNSVDFGGVKEGHEVDVMPSYASVASGVKGVDSPKFVYYGIRDEEQAESVEKLHTLIKDLMKRVNGGEVLYVHCKGGTGRTGLVAASILGSMYPDLDTEEVLKRTYEYCIARWTGLGKCVPPKVKSPATDGQKEQVEAYLNKYASKENTPDSDGGGCAIM